MIICLPALVLLLWAPAAQAQMPLPPPADGYYDTYGRDPDEGRRPEADMVSKHEADLTRPYVPSDNGHPEFMMPPDAPPPLRSDMIEKSNDYYGDDMVPPVREGKKPPMYKHFEEPK